MTFLPEYIDSLTLKSIDFYCILLKWINNQTEISGKLKMKDNKSHQSGLRNASGCMYSHIVMFCSLVRLPGRRMCAQLIGTFYLITSYVLLSIKISSAVSGEQLASYLLVWTFELDFGSPLGCWARLIYPHHSVLISEPPLQQASTGA